MTALPDTEPGGTDVDLIVYSGCAAGADVMLYRINRGGHTWPGGWHYYASWRIGPTSLDIDTNEIMWEFFRTHPMP